MLDSMKTFKAALGARVMLKNMNNSSFLRQIECIFHKQFIETLMVFWGII